MLRMWVFSLLVLITSLGCEQLENPTINRHPYVTMEMALEDHKELHKLIEERCK